MTRLFTFAMIVTLLSCDRETSKSAPAGEISEIKIGVSYPHKLYVHCGVLGTRFAGREWDANPPLRGSPGNPPQGWDENEEAGTMTLEAADRAIFRSSVGNRSATFVPRPTGAPDPNKNCE